MITFDSVKLNDIVKEYSDVYDLYCRTVSSDGMCISLQQISLIVYILRHYNVGNRMDTGSGLSSYVMGKETNSNQIHVSVEDSNHWIERSRSFLQQQNISTNNLTLWSDFDNLPYTYDFIYHDLGNMSTRQHSLSKILSKLNSGGYIMLDDIHKGGYRNYVETNLVAPELIQIDVKSLSVDSFGRYAYLYQKS